MRNLERVGEVGFAREADLPFVVLGREIVGTAEEGKIFTGAVLADLVEEFDEAQVYCAPGGGG